MDKQFRLFFAFCLIAGWWMYPPANLRAEFYKYVDKDGRIFYVDDLGKVPEAYQDQIKVYREKFDYLSEEERSRALEKERARIQQHEQEQQLQMNEQLQEMQQAEEEEKKRQAEAGQAKIRRKYADARDHRRQPHPGPGNAKQ